MTSGAAPDGPALGIFAHPDDAEIACGATLAKVASSGRRVELLILTNGDRGSQDRALDRSALARTRLRESEAAGGMIGLAGVEVLDVHDGDLENTAAVRARVVRAIRELRPTTVFSCDPTAWFFDNRESQLNAGSSAFYNHSDHRTAGAIALDSVYPGAGNPHYFAEHLGEGLEAWDVYDVWLGWTNEPNHYEDVTGFVDVKVRALLAHASQVEGDGIRFFREWLPREAEEAGAKIGVTHAEAFRVLDLR